MAAAIAIVASTKSPAAEVLFNPVRSPRARCDHAGRRSAPGRLGCTGPPARPGHPTWRRPGPPSRVHSGGSRPKPCPGRGQPRSGTLRLSRHGRSRRHIPLRGLPDRSGRLRRLRCVATLKGAREGAARAKGTPVRGSGPTLGGGQDCLANAGAMRRTTGGARIALTAQNVVNSNKKGMCGSQATPRQGVIDRFTGGTLRTAQMTDMVRRGPRT